MSKVGQVSFTHIFPVTDVYVYINHLFASRLFQQHECVCVCSNLPKICWFASRAHKLAARVVENICMEKEGIRKKVKRGEEEEGRTKQQLRFCELKIWFRFEWWILLELLLYLHQTKHISNSSTISSKEKNPITWCYFNTLKIEFNFEFREHFPPSLVVFSLSQNKIS